MIFLSSTSAAAAPSTATASVSTGAGGTSIAGSDFVVGVSVTGPGVTSGVARMREIGGKTERLIFSSPSARFLGFFWSISETDSGRALVEDGGVGGASTRRAGVSTFAGAGFSTLAEGVAAVRAGFGAGSGALALLVALTCLRFGAAALWCETAAELLRAGADLCAVVLLVVFAAILFF